MGRGLGSQVINPAKYFIVGGSGSAAGFLCLFQSLKSGAMAWEEVSGAGGKL